MALTEDKNVNTDQDTNTIISELLCYIQNKMSTTNHDFVVKTVVEFYSSDAIHQAKQALFMDSINTNIRLKKYNIDAAKLDCRDIISKMNELGVKCPIYVAQDVTKLPLATPDAFDLAKISRDIADVMTIHEHVLSSFTVLSCLQNDFKSVLNNCSKIGDLEQQISSLKLLVENQHAYHTLVHEPPQSDTLFVEDVSQEAEDDGTEAEDDGTEAEDVGTPVDDGETHIQHTAVLTAVLPTARTTIPNAAGNSNNPTTTAKPVTDDGHSVLRLNDRPPHLNAWMTEGGFVVKEKRGNKNHRSVFVNTALHKSDNITLKAAKFTPGGHSNRNNGKDNGQCVVFVSRLDPGTTLQNVSRFLRSKYDKNLKVEQVKAKYESYASFKVFAPKSMKRDLLDRYKWHADGGVFVREFVDRRTTY